MHFLTIEVFSCSFGKSSKLLGEVRMEAPCGGFICNLQVTSFTFLPEFFHIEVFPFGLLSCTNVQSRVQQICSVLGISNIGAKCDFEIWDFKGFLPLDKKNSL